MSVLYLLSYLVSIRPWIAEHSTFTTCIFPNRYSLRRSPTWVWGVDSVAIHFMNLSQAPLPSYLFCIFAPYIILFPASQLEETPFSEAPYLPSPAFIYLVLHLIIMSGSLSLKKTFFAFLFFFLFPFSSIHPFSLFSPLQTPIFSINPISMSSDWSSSTSP
ncbi:uncharacterized protein BDV14DRAFT_106859 [Aspergillus stella-maris]|uniref:uncharacterized protein n=1 Tax=Aspergillus stella-maris TaxID=1810926 RepID=UPI003CCC8FEE